MLESAMVKYKNYIVSVSRGSSLEVYFNWDEFWSFRNLKKDFEFKYLTFYHVHPSGFLDYSAKDLHCLKGYNISLGHPVAFSIVCFDNNIIGDLDHRMITYRYIDGEMTIQESQDYKLRYVDLQILKELSYGTEINN